jgi:hypothetical protein
MRRIRPLAFVAVLSALAVPGPLSAEESPLAQVPAQSSIVLHIRGAERLKGRLLNLVKNALPKEVAESAKNRVEELLKEVADGRELRGLPADGPIFIAYPGLPAPGQDSGAAFILRVTNYNEFRDGLLKNDERKTLKKDPAGYETATLGSTDFYFIQRPGFAIVTPTKELAVQFGKRQAGIDTKLNADAAKRFLNADLSVYVDMAAVNREFAPQIKQARDLIEQALRQVTQIYESDKNATEMIKGITALIFQAVEDSRVVLLNLDFRSDGLALQAEAQFATETKTGSLLKSFKPSPLGDVARLPSGQMVYSGLKVEPALLKMFPSALFGSSASPDSGRNQLIQDAMKKMVDAGPRAKFTSAQMPLAGMVIWDYEKPDQAVDAHLQLVKALRAGDTFEGIILKEQPEVKASAVVYRDLKLHSVRTVGDVEKLVAAVIAAQKLPPEIEKEARQQMAVLMKNLAGDERRTWIGSTGKAVVQVSAKDWASAQRQFDQFLDGKATIGKYPAFLETRRHLPAESSVLAMIEAGSYAGLLSEFMQAIVKPMPENKQRPSNTPIAAEGPTNYLGVAITLQPERCSLDLWVPAPAIGAFYKVFEPIFKLTSGAIPTPTVP